MPGTLTIKNATVTLDDDTKYEFDSNKRYKIESPHIVIASYQCDDYIFLQEIQGFDSDKVIEPKTLKEIEFKIRKNG